MYSLVFRTVGLIGILFCSSAFAEGPSCAELFAALAQIPAEQRLALTPRIAPDALRRIDRLSWEEKQLLALEKKDEPTSRRLSVLAGGRDLFVAYELYRDALLDYRDAYQWRVETRSVSDAEQIRRLEKECRKTAQAALVELHALWEKHSAVVDEIERSAAPAPPAVLAIEPDPPARVPRIRFRNEALAHFARSETKEEAARRASTMRAPWQRYATVILAHLRRLDDVRSLAELRSREKDVKRYGPHSRYYGYYAIEADQQFRIIFRWDAETETACDVLIDDYHAED